MSLTVYVLPQRRVEAVAVDDGKAGTCALVDRVRDTSRRAVRSWWVSVRVPIGGTSPLDGLDFALARVKLKRASSRGGWISLPGIAGDHLQAGREGNDLVVRRIKTRTGFPFQQLLYM